MKKQRKNWFILIKTYRNVIHAKLMVLIRAFIIFLLVQLPTNRNELHIIISSHVSAANNKSSLMFVSNKVLGDICQFDSMYPFGTFD